MHFKMLKNTFCMRFKIKAAYLQEVFAGAEDARRHTVSYFHTRNMVLYGHIQGKAYVKTLCCSSSSSAEHIVEPKLNIVH